MKILVLYDYPPSPGGLATQGDLLYRGLVDLGVDAHPVHFESPQEKEWYYRWFKPDAVVGVGYWGHAPDLIMHPQRYGVQPVPWLVANGFVANYREVLNALPLILVPSNWVKETYIRDGIRPEILEVLPVGCDTDTLVPRDPDDQKVAAVREAIGASPDQTLILTVGGDAASKGAQEIMQALAIIDAEAPDWIYACKVWPQPRTYEQNLRDLQLATQLGIDKKVVFTTNVVSRNFVPYLLAACDIYAAPSRLEGFGMPMVEAGACEKPVVSLAAMGMLDTLVHGETALLTKVAQEIQVANVTVGEESGFEDGHEVAFPQPRTVEYRADVQDLAGHLLTLMMDRELRRKMGEAGRRRVVEHFDYRRVARRLVQLLSERLGIS
jgi:glycosyltransferase involved in cell wall biosynthesis